MAVEFWLSGFIPPFYAEPLFELHKINKTGFSFLRSLSACPPTINLCNSNRPPVLTGWNKNNGERKWKVFARFWPQISLQANNDAAAGRIKSEMQGELWAEFVVHYALAHFLPLPAQRVKYYQL
jgi:hypothetical protein